MGPINWLAAGLSALLAMAIDRLWYGPLLGGAAPGADRRFGATGARLLLQAFSALMLAHNFARLGAAKLAAKPWLYWMQSGGIALGFIIPALWIGYAHRRIGRREALADAAFWLVVYLATGTMFWALR